MKGKDLRALPILDQHGKFIGILTLLDLLKVVFEADSDPIRSRQVVSSVDKIRDVIKGEYLHVVDSEISSELLVMVGAMSAEGFTNRLHQLPPSQLLVVSGDRPTIQLPAVEHGVKVLVITGGYSLSPGLLQLAKLNNVTVISCPFDTATTTMRIKSARRIDSAVQTDCVTLSSKMPVADARQLVERTRQSLFPVLDDEGNLFGVLSKSDLISPPKTQLVLVDHNELTQAVLGADEAVILEGTMAGNEDEAVENVGRAMAAMPEVLEVYLTTGEYDYFIKVAVNGTNGYEEFLRKRLYKVQGIRHSRSSFTLRCLKNAYSVPPVIDPLLS